jgi:cysteine-rich repeat protein
MVLAVGTAYAADAEFVSLAQGTSITGSPMDLSYAGTFNIDVGPPFDGPLTEAYCVDISHHIAIGDVVPQVTPAYPCQVVYILNAYYPNAAPLLAPTSHEAAAIQAAIWFFTDGFVISGPADIKARAEAIIADANGSNCVPVPIVPQSMTVTPASATNYLPADVNHDVVATLTGSDNQPLAGYPVTVTITGVSGGQSFSGTTDNAGQLLVSYANTFAAAGSDTITATATFDVPVGLEFKLPDKQGIVLAGVPVTGVVQATAQKNWVPAACGDGAINQTGELCDDGNAIDGDGCDSNCRPTGCGNGVQTAPELCDDGNLIDADGCDANCTPTGCGNGIPTAGEQCDDGNQTDGDGCDHNCTLTACGNGVVTTPEQCDDGNQADGDGCDHNCTLTACGNGVVTAPEQCDDGNIVSGDGCDQNCTFTVCGNGVVTAPEQCDDGNVVSGDGCDANCTPTACGNGIVTAPEQCDDGNLADNDGCDSNCTAAGCGNGIVNPPEQCDDHNVTSGDGCDSNCTSTACGNGVQTSPEQCDDGNLVNGDGCDANCTPTLCGNGVVTPPEQCDDGNTIDGDGCDTNCTTTACGNGVVTPPEQCDDGNTIDGDGCEMDCLLPTCGNGVVDTAAGEQCDDGNVADGDGCSVTCQLQEICHDLLDNDGDSLIDCEDPDCPICEQILKDPAAIKFRNAPKQDFLHVNGGVIPLTPISPATETTGFLLDNAEGVLFRQILPPGAMVPQGAVKLRFLDKAAKSLGGLNRFQLYLKGGIWHVSVFAYGDLGAATVPTMATQVLIGDDSFIYKATWTQTKHGWKLEFPRVHH